MAEVKWMPQAGADLEAIREYYERVAPDYAQTFVDGAVEKTLQLEAFPRMGRVVPEIGDEDLRELIYRQYRIIYKVESECAMAADITIEPVALRHAEDVQRLASHPEVVATTNLPDPYPKDGARKWIEALLPRQEAGEEYAFVILNENEELVGVAGLVDVAEEVAELGYWIGKPYWNRGYATAANRQVLNFAFGTLGMQRVFARPLKRNRPSRRVLEKLGFSFR